MESGDGSHRRSAPARYPPETRYPPGQHPYRVQSGYSPSRQLRQAPRDQPLVRAPRQAPSPTPADRPTVLRPAAPWPEPAGRPHRIPRRRTWPRLAGGVLIAGACAASGAWYVPRVVAADRQLLTGTVSSSGVVALNFAAPGEISKVNVRLNQTVRKGEVLAVEYAPDADSIVAADKAAVAAEQAKMAQLRAAAAATPANAAVDNAELAAAKAQLASGQAQLATDRLKVASTEIVAPSAGVVVAANGQAGETVTASGIRNYVSDSRQQATVQGPQFSLLPEGPLPVRRDAAGGSSLPVIALRVSNAWQVVALVPEGSVSAIKAGRMVTISVPAAGIADVPGQVEQVVPTPVSTAEGVFYQAVITATGRVATVPMNGMAADIRLLS